MIQFCHYRLKSRKTYHYQFCDASLATCPLSQPVNCCFISVEYLSIFTKIQESPAINIHKLPKEHNLSNTDSNWSFNTCLYQYFTREGLETAGKSPPVQDTQIHNATITLQFMEAGVYYYPKAAGLKIDSVMKHCGILCPLLCSLYGIFALLQGSLRLQWGLKGPSSLTFTARY